MYLTTNISISCIRLQLKYSKKKTASQIILDSHSRTNILAYLKKVMEAWVMLSGTWDRKGTWERCYSIRSSPCQAGRWPGNIQQVPIAHHYYLPIWYYFYHFVSTFGYLFKAYQGARRFVSEHMWSLKWTNRGVFQSFIHPFRWPACRWAHPDLKIPLASRHEAPSQQSTSAYVKFPSFVAWRCRSPICCALFVELLSDFLHAAHCGHFPWNGSFCQKGTRDELIVEGVLNYLGLIVPWCTYWRVAVAWLQVCQ